MTGAAVDSLREGSTPADGGDMGAMIRAHDWSTSPLGQPENWAPSLRTVVSLMLNSRFPMFAAWGPELGFLYNDAYVEILGAKHPGALGGPFSDVWEDAWSDLRPLVDAALAGQASYFEDWPLQTTRKGYDEQAWFTFSYSPIADENGAVRGMFCACTETTSVVVNRRRQALQNALEDTLRPLVDPGEIMQEAAQLLGQHLGVDRTGYAEIDADEATFTVERDWSKGEMAPFIGRHRLDDFGPALIRALREGQAVAFADVLDDPLTSGEGVANAFEAVTVRAALTVPLVKEGRFAAALYAHCRLPRAWTEHDATLVRDVAERTWNAVARVRAEQEARDSDASLRALNLDLERRVIERAQARGLTWKVSPYLMGALNAQGYFETSNPAWQTMLGWSESELERMSIFDLVHADDVETTRAAFERTLQGQPALQFENRFRQKAGGHVWLSWVSVAEDGVIYCTGRDVTEEKAQADALAERTAERDRLWTLSQDMLARANYDGDMSAVSPSWMQVLGWSETELLSRPYAEIIHPDDVAATVDGLVRMGQSGQPTRFENRILTAGEEWKPIEWTVAPEADGINFIAIGRDISALKAREQELLEAQEHLRQAQKMEAVGQLTGGLAHDFNNLLAGISGSLDLIQTRIAQGRIADVERYLLAAQGASRRAAALTHRLLAFSRRQTLEPKSTNVNRLVSGIEDLIRRTVGPQIEIEAVAKAGLWPVLVDANQLENALLNLAINARDAMPDGGKLTIETANRWVDERSAQNHDLPPGQYVSLCVSDTGTGMSPDVVKRAFDPFFTTKPIGMGTGLGLSMIYGFARQSGGQVRIYSELGDGTMVCIYLPRSQSDEDVAHLASPEPGRVRAPGMETVLVIDDEPTVRMLVVDVLQDLGYSAIEAEDGPSGLAILRSDQTVDLLITDVGLPNGLNGRQVADAARQLRPNLKVLFVTGYAENAVLSHGHLDPGMEVVTKPFDLTVLADRVIRLVTASAS